jgi:hypothetical protein
MMRDIHKPTDVLRIIVQYVRCHTKVVSVQIPSVSLTYTEHVE